MSFSQTELDALRSAYASGVTEVRYDGKVTRYDDGAALLARIRVIEGEIARAASGSASKSVSLAAFRRD
ncbi:hypothetical protein OEW28_18680 [Defluviimonas sp. WL0002]|uniref:GpW protein n=1 Tax=Albidovulum marisflavi TaxID=2984159 RepID=A0ABT2ZHM8_9RHOB|nr:hypothetical protein [Defluviimonas sp. WL0002]MCV2870643.1 hypothetical protein [Defluviimonas sp. WL0002]